MVPLTDEELSAFIVATATIIKIFLLGLASTAALALLLRVGMHSHPIISSVG